MVSSRCSLASQRPNRDDRKPRMQPHHSTPSVALPGFAVLLLSGVAMVARTRLAASTPWLLSGLVLFAVLTLVHFLVYRPCDG